MNDGLRVTWTEDGTPHSMSYTELIDLQDRAWVMALDDEFEWENEGERELAIDVCVAYAMAALDAEAQFLGVTPAHRFIHMGKRGKDED